MPVDTRGLQHAHVGKRLRIKLASGENDEVKLLELTVCQQPEPCCGVTYRLLSASRADAARQQGAVYWTGFQDVEDFQVLGD